MAITSPLLEVYDDFTLEENYQFVSRFKDFYTRDGAREFAERIGLEKHLTKQVRHFSSGMRQRLKLGLAILSKSELLLLDEPASHLDAKAIQWFNDTLNEHLRDRILVVASNSHPEEIASCKTQVIVEDYR